MRLLNTTTGQFEIIDDPQTIRFAILSHVWAKPGKGTFIAEQTYQEIVVVHRQFDFKKANVLSSLSDKVQKACKIAREHGYLYIWIDTCCIDRSSSAELSEAIKSMFHWYQCSKVCYALLDDVDDHSESAESQFCQSTWFKRGWTLQELLAPHNVLFLSKNWAPIGTKYDLAEVVKRAAAIDAAVLRGERLLSQVSVAERMSWASLRRTTKEEDEAYCLIGVFGVHLVLNYGEGRNAFIRLQKAILKHISDQSIFAWGSGALPSYQPLFKKPEEPKSLGRLEGQVSGSPESYLLASSPKKFANALNVTTILPEVLAEELDINAVAYSDYTTTSYGIRTKLPLLHFWDRSGQEHRLAFLACKDGTRFIALILRPVRPGKSSAEMYVGSQSLGIDMNPHTAMSNIMGGNYIRLISLSKEQMNAYLKEIQVTDIYIHHGVPRIEQTLTQGERIHTKLWSCFPSDVPSVKLARWCPPFLKKRGYAVSSIRSGRNHGFILWWHGRRNTTIKVERCTCDNGRDHGWLRAVVSPKGVPVRLLFSDLRTEVARVDKSLCEHNHVINWDFRDGIASQVFQLVSPRPIEAVQLLRLTLSLKNPATSPVSYILEIDVVDSSLNEAAFRRDPSKSSHGNRRSLDLPRVPPSLANNVPSTTSSGSHHMVPVQERSVSNRSQSTDAALERVPTLTDPQDGASRDLSRPDIQPARRHSDILPDSGLVTAAPDSVARESDINVLARPRAYPAEQRRPSIEHPSESLVTNQDSQEVRPQAQTSHRGLNMRAATAGANVKPGLEVPLLAIEVVDQEHTILDAGPSIGSGSRSSEKHPQYHLSAPQAHHSQASSFVNPPRASRQHKSKTQTSQFVPEDRGRRPPSDRALQFCTVAAISSQDDSDSDSDLDLGSNFAMQPHHDKSSQELPPVLTRDQLKSPEQVQGGETNMYNQGPHTATPKSSQHAAQPDIKTVGLLVPWGAPTTSRDPGLLTTRFKETDGGRMTSQGGDLWTDRPMQRTPESIIPQTIPGTPIPIEGADLPRACTVQTVAAPRPATTHSNTAWDLQPTQQPSMSVAVADHANSRANAPSDDASRSGTPDVGGRGKMLGAGRTARSEGLSSPMPRGGTCLGKFLRRRQTRKKERNSSD